GVRRNEVLLLRQREPERAEQLRRVIRLAARDENQVLVLAARRGHRGEQLVFAGGLDVCVEARLGLARPHDADRAELLGLIDERVELGARVPRGARYHQRADDTALADDLAEGVERSVRPDR